MEVITKLFANANPMVYVVIGVFVIIFIGLTIAVFFSKSKPKTKKAPKQNTKLAGAESGAEEKEVVVQSTLGTGNIKCACFTPGIIKFTTIPKPIGEAYLFDPSCPFSGMGYIVKEDENGKIVDYDPREVAIDLKNTPEFAYLATHWPIVKDVFSIVVSAWKSPGTWFAAGLCVAVFICGLVVFD